MRIIVKNLLQGSMAVALCIIAALHAWAQVTPIPKTSAPESPASQTTPLTNQTPGQVIPLHTDDGSEPGVVKVYAVGTASIFGGNVKSARQAALQSAYAEAVARGAGTDIGRLTVVRNVKAVSDIVMSRSRGFVKSYNITGEGVMQGNPPRYEVRIEALVTKEPSDNADDLEGLKLFLQVLGNPRILVLLPAKDLPPDFETAYPGSESQESTNIRVDSPEAKITIQKNKSTKGQEKTPVRKDGVPVELEEVGSFRGAEAAVAQAFSRYGFQVLTSDDVISEGFCSKEQLSRALRGITKDAVEVSRAAGADLLLTGVIQVESNRIKPYGVEFTSVTATASAKVMVVSNGYMVDAFHQTRTAAHPNRLAAYSTALDEIADRFAQTLAWKIPSILASQNRVTMLSVSGVNIDEAQKLKSGLEQMAGVEAVRFDQLPTTQSPRADFEVLTGYVRVEQDEMVSRCGEALGRNVSLMSADKFTIKLKVL